MRRYYSQRKGTTSTKISLEALKEIFSSIFQDFRLRGYFDEYFGIICTDGDIPGKIGQNIEGYVLRKIRKNNLWPILEKYNNYSEEDLFDMIEFIFDHVSFPLKKDAFFHEWNDCGWHYKNFDQIHGQLDYANELNQFLNDYKDGFELNSHSGEILYLLKPEFRPLLEAVVPTNDDENIQSKIKYVVEKFRKYGSTLNDRGEAVRSLADCLEFLRPDIKKVLDRKDESDLFNIVNNFGVRHHNLEQKTNYNKNIWLNWMFYYYLSTLHACLRLIRQKQKGGE